MSCKIIISYRRSDSGGITGRISDRLKKRYGSKNVFIDIDSIPFGIEFSEYTRAAISKCDVMLAVIGPRWTGDSSGERIRDSNDPVRIEIEEALGLKIPIVPVLIDHTTTPKSEELPESMKNICKINAVNLSSGIDFDIHMIRITKIIDRILKDKRNIYSFYNFFNNLNAPQLTNNPLHSSSIEANRQRRITIKYKSRIQIISNYINISSICILSLLWYVMYLSVSQDAETVAGTLASIHPQTEMIIKRVLSK
ncbi:toll/interleukin-1 receptor domain-containing protein [Methylobacterium sp. EM32]|uniref:toll/interleukin-1 receptor domain-containing protein n=1 Tax=Methylobacterium sp. EM32 TaxID=3163481 RepID=UPI0033AA5E44